jgi:hypothetical protein
MVHSEGPSLEQSIGNVPVFSFSKHRKTEQWVSNWSAIAMVAATATATTNGWRN